MKIAHITPGVRGLATYCINIYNYFQQIDRTDVDNLIISEAKWTKQRIPLFEPKSILIANILPFALSVREVEQKLLEYKPDILHHHLPTGRLEFSIGRLQQLVRVPLIITYHVGVSSTRSMIDKLMHGWFLVSSKKNMKYAHVHVAISQFVKRQLEAFPNIPNDRVVQIYAGVDTEIYKPLPYKPHDTLEVLFVGQIRQEKGIDILIKSVLEVSKTRKIRLSIIGNGNAVKLLEKKTRGKPSIRWLGFIPNQINVARYYAEADVTVLPNRWEEAFSYIPIESMSCGTPVIASRTGGNPEIVIQDNTGYIFTPGSLPELSDILRKVEIPELREMGARGREHILKKHTMQQFGAKYYSLYKNIMEDPENIKQID